MKQLRIVLALSGLAVALFGSQLIPVVDSSNDVLVWVNRQPVTAQQLAFAERRLLAASGNSLTAAERRSVIELLIDEELMLQRAHSTGTFAADPAVRKAIVQAVIDKTVADFQHQSVSSRQLRRFYQEHQSVFERPPRVAIQALRFESPGDAQRAYSALVAGARFEDLGQVPAASPIAHLPSSPLPMHMLRRYLGNSLTEVALTLQQGDVSEPVIRPDGVYLLRARSVQRAGMQSFEQVRDRVEAEYDFRGRESALELAVARLWARADIHINDQVVGAYKVPEKYTSERYFLAGSSTNDAGGDR
jgi:PPIC-type PPIASE domain